MLNKKALFLIGLLVLVLVGSVSWFVFNQSKKVGRIEEKLATNQTEASEDRQFSSTANQSKGLQGGEEQSSNASLKANKTEGNRTSANKTQDKEVSLSEKVRDFIVTPLFISDLVEYLTSRFYPAGCLENKSDKAKLKLNFKSLNARYGIELIGLKHESENLKKAREEVLGYLTRTDYLIDLYEQNSDKFINKLIEKAKETEREYKIGDKVKKKPLSLVQIETMLSLMGGYLENIARVFAALARNNELYSLTDNYLEEVKRAVNANYALNKVKNREELLQREFENKKEGREKMRDDLVAAKAEIEAAADRYKRAILAREKARKKLIAGIKKNAGRVDLQESEILYAAEWVYRRLQKSENYPAIEVAANLLKDLAAKMQEISLK